MLRSISSIPGGVMIFFLASAFTSSDVDSGDSPGQIVIRPQPRSATDSLRPPAPGLDTDPNRPGYWVIRPGGSAATREPVLREEPASPNSSPPAPPARTVSTTTSAAPTDTPRDPATVGVPEKTSEDGRVILETWDAAYIRDQKIGYFHVVVREYNRDGQKYLYATKTQRLTIGRFGEIVTLWSEDATMERPDGTILTTRMRQGLGRDQKLSLTGTVVGDRLRVQIEGASGGIQEIPWPKGVVGVAQEARLLAERKPKPGDTLDYLYYEGRLNRVVKILIRVQDLEEISLRPGQAPRKVLRIEQGMEAIGNFRLPPSTMFCDPDSYTPLRIDSEMPMMGGRLTVIRTTKEEATRPVGAVPDIFQVQSIRLNVAVPGIHQLPAVVYKITTTGEVPARQLFPSTDRQQLKPVDETGKVAELRVSATPLTPPEPDAPADPGPEFLGSSFFIDWETDLVKRYAAQAIAGLPATASRLRKAQAVESWVHRNMKAVEFSQAMATCSNVAQTLSGDCTEYAMLCVGLCRALGIPARTAMGLVYAPVPDGKPFLAYHMWYEVYDQGRWHPLDATLGQGAVGPGHLKITDASWHQERSFAPLLPVLTVLSSTPTIEVIRISEPRR